jgi:hypothetical protein
MPYLGDYLGHLLAEVTIARVQADLEAVRVAELYASHPLLKNMPVPHFRLPTMTLDVPVAVKEMEEAKPGTSPRGGVDLPVLRERFARILDQNLERAEIKLSSRERENLDQELDRSLSRVVSIPYVSASATHVADDLVSTTIKALQGPSVEAPKLEKLTSELGAAARKELASTRSAPPRLMVLVTTAELREAGPRELLAQLHLSISEEALEWSVTESQGQSRTRLAPE